MLDPKDPFFQTAIANMIDERVDPLGVLVRQLQSGTDWTVPPSLLNSWAPASGTAIGYYKDPWGVVRLRGRLAGGANASVAFTLPAGYRPGQSETYAAPVFDGTRAVGGFVYVTTSGDVTLYFATGGVDIGLGGVTFRAEQ